MLAFLNLGPLEVVVILVVAVLVFGRDLPQAASKAYFQFRKLRGALDDLRRDSGIDREIRNIERTVREAEWEARNAEAREGEDKPSWRSELPKEAGGTKSADGPVERAPEPGPGDAADEPGEGSGTPTTPGS